MNSITLQGYYDFITSLSINQVILLYLFSYLYLNLAKKILKHEIGLDGFISTSKSPAFSTQPKILLTLISIYVLNHSLSLIGQYFDLSNPEYLLISLFSMLIALFFSIQFTEILIEKIYFFLLKNGVKKLLKTAKFAPSKSKYKVAELKVKADAKDYYKQIRTHWSLLFINSFILMILSINAFKISLFSGILIIAAGFIHIIGDIKEVRDTLTIIGNRHGNYKLVMAVKDPSPST